MKNARTSSAMRPTALFCLQKQILQTNCKSFSKTPFQNPAFIHIGEGYNFLNKRDALFASLWLLSVEGGKLHVSVNKLKTFLKMGVQNRVFIHIGEECF